MVHPSTCNILGFKLTNILLVLSRLKPLNIFQRDNTLVQPPVFALLILTFAWLMGGHCADSVGSKANFAGKSGESAIGREPSGQVLETIQPTVGV